MNDPGTSPRNERAFTLTELLITITIIAVLALIVFALGRRMQDHASKITCTNNLRQIGVALASHNSDLNRLPSRGSGVCWDRALLPFMGYSGGRNLTGNSALARDSWPEVASIAGTFSCPSDRKKRDPGFYKRSYAIVPWTTNWSNGTQFRGWKNRPYNVGVPLSIVGDLGRAATVVEWHSGTDDDVANHLGSGGHAFHDRGGPDFPDDTVHGRRQIVLFADGHTEVLPFISNADFVEKYWPGELGNID